MPPTPYRQPNAKNAAAPTALLFGTICQAVLPCRCFPSVTFPWRGGGCQALCENAWLVICVFYRASCFSDVTLLLYHRIICLSPASFGGRRGLSNLNESMHSKRNWWSFRAGWSPSATASVATLFFDPTRKCSLIVEVSVFVSVSFLFFFFLAWQLHRQLHQVLFRRSCKRREACVCSHRCVALTTESSALRRTMLWECGRKEWMHFKLQTSSSVAFGWWYACSCRFYSANQRFMHLSAKWVRLHQTPFSCVVVILLCWSQLQFILL